MGQLRTCARILVGLLVIACGGSTVGAQGSPEGGTGGSASTGGIQFARDYDRSCQFDGDCMPVIEGNPCSCQRCWNASIAWSAQAKWDADRGGGVCSPPGECIGESCIVLLPACVSGACTVRPPRLVYAEDYDQSCRADSDCVAVPTGEVCSVCKCAAGAINRNALPEYEKDIRPENCNPGPSPCDCAAPATSRCDTTSNPGAGTCVLG